MELRRVPRDRGRERPRVFLASVNESRRESHCLHGDPRRLNKTTIVCGWRSRRGNDRSLYCLEPKDIFDPDRRVRILIPITLRTAFGSRIFRDTDLHPDRLYLEPVAYGSAKPRNQHRPSQL